MKKLVIEFRRLWESGPESPDIHRFAAENSATDVDELHELVLEDQRQRKKRNCELSTEVYIASFPQLADCLDRHSPDSKNNRSSRLDVSRNDSSPFSNSDSEKLTRDLKSDSRSNLPEHVSISSFDTPGQDVTLDSHPSNSETVQQSTNQDSSWDLYEQVKEIAVGGMGVVYQAKHRLLKRWVALKLIRSGQLSTSEQVQRFYAEAEAAAKLDHPGIVPVFESGTLDGLHFFSMALVNGKSLDQIVKKQGPRPQDEAARLTIKVAQAIQYAHDQGIIHRDIKPHNVLLDQTSNQPRVTDFGLAKLINEDSGLTATGQVMGTPSYMPPEQAVGRQEMIDQQSDIYSIGATLYFLLTGRPPFEASSIAETLQQVISSEPVAPRVLNPGLSKDLETICLKCLRREKQHRYATAQELVDDLTRWQSHEPILARPVSRIERIWKWCRQRPALIGTTIAALAIISLVTILMYEQRNKAEAKRLLDGLLNAETSQVAAVMPDFEPYRRWIQTDLKNSFEHSPSNSTAKLNAGMALLGVETQVEGFLKDRLLTLPAGQFKIVRNLLEKHGIDPSADYREYLRSPKAISDQDRRFRAICALAWFAPDHPDWNDKPIADMAVEYLVSVSPSELGEWREAFKPVKSKLSSRLEDLIKDDARPYQQRLFAADLLASYASENRTQLFEWLADAKTEHFETFFRLLAKHPEQVVSLGTTELNRRNAQNQTQQEQIRSASRKANIAILLSRLGRSEILFALLKDVTDPDIRTFLIARIHQLNGVSCKKLIEQLSGQSKDESLTGTILTLGQFDPNSFSPNEKNKALEHLRRIYSNGRHAGSRSAAEWTLRKWKTPLPTLEATKSAVNSDIGKSSDAPFWIQNRRGETFVVIKATSFQMGSPSSESPRFDDETQHHKSIERTIAFATKPVTRSQWSQFEKAVDNKIISADAPQLKMFLPTTDSPMTLLTWYEAAQYCNWLSESEGIPPDQWCYSPNEKGEFAAGMKAKDRFWELEGYRLPTESEWEFACRAGSSTARYFGNSPDLLGDYAWSQLNSGNQAHPVGTRIPNDFGLFDMQGNAYEWCHDELGNYPTTVGKSVVDEPSTRIIKEATKRMVRGGSFYSPPIDVRSALRFALAPGTRLNFIGMRPVRTIK